jgi:UDP-N-acetylglucosamine 2-epimerase (non-hydrolysing)
LRQTQKAVDNLHSDNIRVNIFLTGNTVIDALLWAVAKVRSKNSYQELFTDVDLDKKIILITGHRRESFGKPFENICTAILLLAEKYPDAQFVILST